MVNPAKNTICLWYDKDAEEAARFYAKTFPDSSVGAVHRAPGDFPSGKKGDPLIVEFTVMGIPCIGLKSWRARRWLDRLVSLTFARAHSRRLASLARHRHSLASSLVSTLAHLLAQPPRPPRSL